MPKAIIFDVDGTLVDTVLLHAKAWSETFHAFGIEVSVEDVRKQIGKGGDQLMPVFLNEEEIKRQGEDIEAARADLFKARYLPQAKGFPGCRALFEAIRAQGSAIALASSCKADELDAYVELANVDGLVDVSTTSDDADKSKPFPDIFLAALDKLPGVAASDAIVVGDSPYDAEAAGKAGIKTVGLLSGGFTADELKAAGCIAIYRDPQDLLESFAASPLAQA